MKLKYFLMAFMATYISTVRAEGFDPDTLALSYEPQVVYTPAKTTFLFSGSVQGNRPVLLRLYKNGIGGKAVKTIRMERQEAYGWIAEVPGDWKDYFYTFDASGNRKHPRETPGIFARAVGVNGARGAVIELKDTDPEGWESDVRPPLRSPADLMIYEMHFRDFSIARKDARYPGKFLALTEPWAIDHLKKLGVNAVHILPSFDYASVDETKLGQPQYNWGYDPLNYNVPEGSYSTDPYTPARRIREFKQMVQALHKAGIRVILDVVYNHTFDLTNSQFQKTVPDAYYRFTKDGKPSNGSGCGNETASEMPLMRHFMIESVKYWAEEYHIDGFRFDLMGVHDIATMNAIRDALTAIDPSIFIYGEGWSAGTCAYPLEKLAMKANIPQMPGIAAFSDDLRDALRGPFNDDAKGAFLAGIPGEEESIKYGIVGGIAHPQVNMLQVNYDKEPWCLEPTQQISYVSCHDDMCLVDRLRTELPGISDEELIRLDKLAQTVVFTSQGVPFMLSGEELLRDKKGVHNSYNSPDSINALPWEHLQTYPQVMDYYSRLLALRAHHPAFRLGNALAVRRHLEFLPETDAGQQAKEGCLVAYRLYDLQGIDPWQEIIVVFNANKTARTVSIPEGVYTVVAVNGTIDEESSTTVKGGTIEVEPQSALILRK